MEAATLTNVMWASDAMKVFCNKININPSSLIKQEPEMIDIIDNNI